MRRTHLYVILLSLLFSIFYIKISPVNAEHPLGEYATNDFTIANFICDVSHQLYKKGNYEDAVYELKVALVVDPDNTCALSFMRELGLTQSELDIIPFRETDEQNDFSDQYLMENITPSSPTVDTSASTKAYTDEILRLKEQLNDQKSQLKNIEMQNKQLNTEKNNLEEIAQDLQQAINKKPKIQKVTETVIKYDDFALNEALAETKRVSEQADDEIFTLEQRINSLENQIDEKNYIIEEKNIQLQTLKETYDQELVNIQNQISQQKAIHSDTKKDHTQALLDVENTYKQKLADTRKHIRELTDDYQARLMDKDKETQQLNQSLAKIQDTSSSLHDTINLLENRIKELESKLTTAERNHMRAMDDNNALKEKTQKAQLQLQEEKQRQEDLRREDYLAIRDLNNKILLKDKDIAAAHRETEQHKRIIHTLEREAENFEYERHTNRQLVDQLNEQLEFTQQSVKRLEETAEIKENTIEDLNKRITRHQDRIYELEKLFDEAVKKLETYRKHYKSNGMLLDETIEEIRELK